MRDTIFDVSSSQHRKRPEEDRKIAINQHCPFHFESVIVTLGLAILLRCFGNCSFVLDTCHVTELTNFTFNVFRCIVDMEECDLLAMHGLNSFFVVFLCDSS